MGGVVPRYSFEYHLKQIIFLSTALLKSTLGGHGHGVPHLSWQSMADWSQPLPTRWWTNDDLAPAPGESPKSWSTKSTSDPQIVADPMTISYQLWKTSPGFTNFRKLQVIFFVGFPSKSQKNIQYQRGIFQHRRTSFRVDQCEKHSLRGHDHSWGPTNDGKPMNFSLLKRFLFPIFG